jgi:SagB-type dehydrogenase family enzyme
MADELDELRPLIAGTIRWEDDAAVIELGPNEVRVVGDVTVLQAILGQCDGRTSLTTIMASHGEAARELVALLLGSGAVIAAEHAWRVLHRQSSVGSALGRPIDEAGLAALIRGTYVPATTTQQVIAPQAVASTVGWLASERRSTVPADPARSATLAELAAVLAAAYTVPAAGDRAFRSGSVPSAGALYPLALHVLLRQPLEGADAGLWWSDPATGALHRIAEAPHDAADLFVAEPALETLLAAQEPIVFISADLARPSRKYGARAYRYALMEAGAAMQAAYLLATERGLPLRAIGGIDDDAVHSFLALPDTAVALLALLVGR